MLKVEKIARQEIAISLRRKDSFFNRTFIRALLWALTFHLGALVFFHIAPFSLVSSRILPPAFVESDLFEGPAIASLEQEGPPKHYLHAPKESHPMLPSIPSLTMMEYFEDSQKDHRNGVDLFALAEQEHWSSKFFQPHGKMDFIPIEINLTGLLAGRPFVLESSPSVREAFKAIYRIEVENQSGTVFWYRPQSVPAQKKQLVEEVIHSLRFEAAPGFTTAGDIEITFNQRRIHD